jgi:hypothetical protein
MPSSSRLRTLFSRTLLLNAALLAVIGQIGVAGTSLSIAGEEASAAAHVESSGVNLHHGHNPETCVVCRALSFHGNVPSPIAPPAPIASASGVPTGLSEWHVGYATSRSNSSRAPPPSAA